MQKSLALLFALAVWFTGDVSAQNASALDVVGVENFSHIVRDMDRAGAFYGDVLGLKVTANVPFSPNPAIMRLGNTPGAQSRMMALRVPGSDLGVELIEYKDIDRKVQSPLIEFTNIARTPLTGRVQDPGTAILQVRVRNVDALVKR